jgi:acyl-CoA thioesterase I
LTYGLGATKGNDYVSRLEVLSGKDIINMGVSGDDSQDVLNRLDRVIQKKPDLVILMIGGKDVLKKVDSATMFANIEETVTKLKASGAAVMLVGMPGGLLSDPFDETFEAIAERHEAVYVPEFMGSLIRGREYMSDSVHPNDAGYAIAAERIYEVMRKHFK